MKKIFNFAIGFAICLIIALIITAIAAIRSGNGCMIAVCIMGAFWILSLLAVLYLFIERIRKSPCSTVSDTLSCIDKEATADTEKQEDSKKPSWGECYAALAEESYRKSIQKRLRQKQFLKRHPEAEQMIHSLKCIEGSIQGINNAVRKLSYNLRDLQKKIIELSALAE